MDAVGFLAFVFHWGPRELEDLELDELEDWVAQAKHWRDKLQR